MFNQMQDYMNEQMQAFAGQAQRLSADPLTTVREGIAHSASGIKSLRQPVSAAARSGVQLSAVTHETAQQLIELQSRMMTAAITEIAEGLERASEAKDFAAFVTAQADVLRLSAERLVSDANRALEIFTTAGRSVQTVAAEAFEKVAKPAVRSAQHAAKPRRSRGRRAKTA